MKRLDPNDVGGADIGSTQDLLSIVNKLARHLAIELDLHYGTNDSEKLSEEIEDLISASAAMLANGYTIDGVVSEIIEKFYFEDNVGDASVH
ncbi:hypothetical protein [Jannaschia formosa]|uniref:hypothetical protein n=1 Tax=Jannaschia formosa TaxID=2259592 RepID=UPI001075214F|nr:hypothetical protein [Jannaschia formosa]TFL20269.1 hypothetical protein DR046_02715 [Jannaschia formosa]